MTALSQFGGGGPIGSIVQSPFNLVDSRYLPCDGRIISKATYPLLAAAMGNVGTFIATSRTRGTIPTNANLATATADTVNFCHGGADASTQAYTSPDGITWTSRTITGCTQAYQILSDGATGMVAVGASTASYSANSGVTWTAATGTVGASATGALSYAPSIGANGRYLVIQNTGSTFFTSDDRGATWTTRSGILPGNAYYYSCWTGSKFVVMGTAPSNKVYLSDSTGIGTWTTVTLSARNAYGRLISDGNGKVALWDIQGTGLLYYSLDHGATWSYRAFGSMFPSKTLEARIIDVYPTLSYANGKFFLAFGDGTNSDQFDQQFWCSSDLVSWVPLNLVNPYSAGVTTQSTSFCYKAGVYFANDSYAAQSGMTLVEDTTKLQLPNGFQGNIGGLASLSGHNNYQPFIRVA